MKFLILSINRLVQFHSTMIIIDIHEPIVSIKSANDREDEGNVDTSLENAFDSRFQVLSS